MHTTAELSTRLNVTVQTIRRWADQYQQHMSIESRTGDQRSYSDDDLLVLWSIRRWRQLGYSLDDIAARLGRGERVSEGLPEAPASDEAPRALMIPETVHTVALAEIKRLEADRERLQIERDSAVGRNDALNERIAALSVEIGELRGTLKERQSTRFWFVVVIAAVLVAVLITAALLLLAR